MGKIIIDITHSLRTKLVIRRHRHRHRLQFLLLTCFSPWNSSYSSSSLLKVDLASSKGPAFSLAPGISLYYTKSPPASWFPGRLLVRPRHLGPSLPKTLPNSKARPRSLWSLIPRTPLGPPRRLGPRRPVLVFKFSAKNSLFQVNNLLDLRSILNNLLTLLSGNIIVSLELAGWNRFSFACFSI